MPTTDEKLDLIISELQQELKQGQEALSGKVDGLVSVQRVHERKFSELAK
ncbi:MAG: hypothetical protein LBT22_05810 [Peptococcaceae bacterium]|jgi:hypothetical protein|nr:hypothetical protein [Peptococcaceae bacterium]